MMVMVLEDGGYTALPLEPADGVVEIVKGARPAALILDLTLYPWLSGLDVLAGLEAAEPGAPLPVLVYSADVRALNEHAPQLYAQGYGVLAKPFDIEEVLQWLQTRICAAA
jgi:CheY-like chemotaxis protein